MISRRVTIRAIALAMLSAAPAMAAPAYIKSTVNLRAGAGTNNEIVAKIPAGSLVDAANCAEGRCEVEWQGKNGFAIATAIDMSGRVPAQRAAPRRAYRPSVAGSDYVVVDPPVVYEEPVYYYPYRYHRPYYRPYYYGYRPWRRW